MVGADLSAPEPDTGVLQPSKLRSPLTEGVILVHRSAPTRRVEIFASAAADAALRVAGVPDDALAVVREAAAELAGLE